jgi:dipeptidyl aminopeptidase/acylaminoacyl peptidase
MKTHRCNLFALVWGCFISVFVFTVSAQERFTIEQILSAPFPSDLVSAKKADQIAWIEYNQGKRNIYTAVASDFKPKRVTDNAVDDGYDMSDLTISDDGSIIVFVRGHTPNRDGWIANPSSNPDGSERAIWAVRTSEGKPFRLTEGSGPLLSPDGKWVLFQKDNEVYELPVKKPQTYVPLKPLFRAFGRNGNFVWSPDSRKIAFVSDRTDHSFIGIYDHTNRTITYINPGVDRDTSPTWLPDSKKIAFIRRPGSNFAQIIESTAQQQTAARGGGQQPPQQSPAVRRDFPRAAFKGGYTLTFWIADIGTGAVQQFWRNPLDNASLSRITTIRWAGKSVLFSLDQGNWRHYYSLPIVGGLDTAPIDLTPNEGEIESTWLSSDGMYLYYSSNSDDIDRRDIWKTPTSGGTPVNITKGDGIEMYPAVLASGKFVALLYADAKQPLSVAIVPSIGGKAKIIAPKLPKDFPLVKQVVPENVILTADDSVSFHNQVFVPNGIRPSEKRPAILFSHGGPGRQMLLGYHYMFFYHIAYAINQYFANKGYVVISVNYRSGIGYGRDFQRAPNTGSRGSAEYKDVYAAGKYLQSRSDVDSAHIGLWGLSYGGLMTAMGLARNSDLFTAGVDIAGVHLWGNSLDTSNVAYKSSSISTIDKWTSPVLIIQGDDDRNVAFSQSVGLVQLLRAYDRYFELIVIPDEVHDFLVFNHFLRTFNAADEFFDRFLRNVKK